MKIIEPYARLMSPPAWGDETFEEKDGIALLRHIEWCARISHRSEEAVTADSWKRLIKSVVIEHGDWSVVEHASVSVDAYVDRGITHEWVRHRLFSFTQESTRFVNYEKKLGPGFVDPFGPDPGVGADKADKYVRAKGSWADAIIHCEEAYREILAAGYPPQIARSVFPNGLASRIITTGNLRNWRHFLIMRTSQETHPQMKQVTIPLLKEFQAKIPLLFDDIEPDMKQSLAMAKIR